MTTEVHHHHKVVFTVEDEEEFDRLKLSHSQHDRIIKIMEGSLCEKDQLIEVLRKEKAENLKTIHELTAHTISAHQDGHLEHEIHELKASLKKKHEEIHCHLEKLQHTEHRLEDVIGEKEHAERHLCEKEKEISELKERLVKSEWNRSRVEELTKDIEVYTCKNEKLESLVIKLRDELDCSRNSSGKCDPNEFELKLKHMAEELRCKTELVNGLNQKVLELEERNLTLEGLESEKKLMQIEIESYLHQLQTKTHKIKHLRTVIDELECKLATAIDIDFHCHLKELRESLECKVKEIECHKKQIYDLELKTQEIQELIHKNAFLEKENDKHLTLAKEKIHEIDHMRASFEDMEKKVILITQDRDLHVGIAAELGAKIEGLTHELWLWKEKNHEIEKLNLIVAETQHKLTHVTAEKEHLEHVVKEQAEIVHDLKCKLVDLEHKTERYSIISQEREQFWTELKRLTACLGEKDKEIEELKLKLCFIDVDNPHIIILNNTITELRNKISDQACFAEGLQEKIDILEREKRALIELTQKSTLLNVEIQKLKTLVKEKNMEISHLKMKMIEYTHMEIRYTELQITNEELEHHKAQHCREIECLKERISKLKHNEIRVSECEKTIIELRDEKERLHLQINQSQRSIDGWRQKYLSSVDCDSTDISLVSSRTHIRDTHTSGIELSVDKYGSTNVIADLAQG